MNMNSNHEQNADVYETGSALLRAISHPVRLAILDILRQDEACVCHMEAVLGQRQAYISQQLSVLKQAGIIEDQRDGWNVYYRVSDPRIFDMVDVLRQLTQADAQQTDLQPRNCPCPKCNSNKKETQGESDDQY